MTRRSRSKSETSIQTTMRIALAVLFVVFLVSAYFTWFLGTSAIIGIPVQIIVVSLVLPITLISLIFWFAKKQMAHALQNERDE